MARARGASFGRSAKLLLVEMPRADAREMVLSQQSHRAAVRRFHCRCGSQTEVIGSPANAFFTNGIESRSEALTVALWPSPA